MKDALVGGGSNSAGELDSVTPNFSKKFANIHYQSELTGEFGTLKIRFNTTEDDVLNQYARLFPKECAHFLAEMKELGQSVINPNGMSQLRMMSSLTKMPELIFMAMKFFDENFWSNKANVLRFVRKYPKFQIGDRSRKSTLGVIIK